MHIHITKMNKLFLLLLMAPFSSATAQDATYHLPKTAIETTVFIEKSVYTPGDLALYSQRFLKKSAGQEKTEQYRILSIDMAPVPVPDTTKVFTAHIDQKHNIQRLTTISSSPSTPSRHKGQGQCHSPQRQDQGRSTPINISHRRFSAWAAR